MEVIRRCYGCGKYIWSWQDALDLTTEEKKADRYWVRKIIKPLEKEGIIVPRGRET